MILAQLMPFLRYKERHASGEAKQTDPSTPRRRKTETRKPEQQGAEGIDNYHTIRELLSAMLKGRN